MTSILEVLSDRERLALIAFAAECEKREMGREEMEELMEKLGISMATIGYVFEQMAEAISKAAASIGSLIVEERGSGRSYPGARSFEKRGRK